MSSCDRQGERGTGLGAEASLDTRSLRQRSRRFGDLDASIFVDGKLFRDRELAGDLLPKDLTGDLDSYFASGCERLRSPECGKVGALGDRAANELSVAVELYERRADVDQPPHCLERHKARMADHHKASQLGRRATIAAHPTLTT